MAAVASALSTAWTILEGAQIRQAQMRLETSTAATAHAPEDIVHP